MKISLGPIQYYWPQNKVFDFYSEVAESPVDIVYLGETVCYKRTELRLHDWLTIAQNLRDSGKEVVLTTLALLEAAAELHAVRKVCENDEFTVEANDMAAIQLLSEARLPFIAGPTINIYNSQTLAHLQMLGLQRWVMPVELGRDTLIEILSGLATLNSNAPPETEIFSYGKLPLAYSARCFTARAHNVAKDRCELKCLNYADGLLLHSQEKQTLFTINGIQTQSGDTYNLCNQWQEMESIGVSIMRISPQSMGTIEVINELSGAIQKQETIQLDKTEYCNGYWFGHSGLDWIATKN